MPIFGQRTGDWSIDLLTIAARLRLSTTIAKPFGRDTLVDTPPQTVSSGLAPVAIKAWRG